MKKNLKWIVLIGVILLFAIVLSVSKISSIRAPENLSVQAAPDQVGPQIVAQDPVVGQRLDLSPTIQVVFDRAMDQAKTSKAFSLLGPDGQPVSGQSAWGDARTFDSHPPPNSNLGPPISAFLPPRPEDWMGTRPVKPLS